MGCCFTSPSTYEMAISGDALFFSDSEGSPLLWLLSLGPGIVCGSNSTAPAGQTHHSASGFGRQQYLWREDFCLVLWHAANQHVTFVTCHVICHLCSSSSTGIWGKSHERGPWLVRDVGLKFSSCGTWSCSPQLRKSCQSDGIDLWGGQKGYLGVQNAWRHYQKEGRKLVGEICAFIRKYNFQRIAREFKGRVFQSGDGMCFQLFWNKSLRRAEATFESSLLCLSPAHLGAFTRAKSWHKPC